MGEAKAGKAGQMHVAPGMASDLFQSGKLAAFAFQGHPRRRHGAARGPALTYGFGERIFGGLLVSRLLELKPPGAVLSLLCGMYFLYFVNRPNLAIAGPAVRTDLGLTNTDLGIIFAAFGV